MDSLTIQSIQLVDFMCHEHILVEFEKKITCIGGVNGSGKSAIMIALGIVFGQNANSLDRGNNSALIRSGSEKAIIKVILNNHLKFQHELYGDIIIIEKTLKPSKSKLEILLTPGRKGKKASKQLEEIIEKYNLHFNNPLNFLTQDNSKKMLNLAKPEELYGFFHQGTGIAQIEDELEKSRIIIEEMQEKMKEASINKNLIADEIEKDNAKLSLFQFDPTDELRIVELEEKWLDIDSDLIIKDSYEKNVLEAEEEIRKLDIKREELVKENEEAYTIEDTGDLEVLINEKSLKLKSLSNDRIDYTKELEENDHKLASLKTSSELETKKQMALELKTRLEIKKEELRGLRSQREEENKEMRDENEKNSIISKKRDELKLQINYFKENLHAPQKRDKLKTYDEVRKRIDLVKWEDSVLGPVSEYIKLKEPKWYAAVSNVLKKSLDHYIVFNESDKKKLMLIFRQLGLNYGIVKLSSKNKMVNFPSNTRYLKISDVIQVNSDIVMKHLILSNDIAFIILIEDRHEAHGVIRSKPSYVDYAYTVTGDRINEINGSISDFSPRMDSYYWFEDKESKLLQLENRMKSLIITKVWPEKYHLTTNLVAKIENEIPKMEEDHKQLVVELEALEILFKSEDIPSIEKKRNSLQRAIKIVNDKIKVLNEELEEAQKNKNEMIRKNERRERDHINNKKTYEKQLQKIEQNYRDFQSKKIVFTDKLKELEVIIKGKSENLGNRPDIIRSKEELDIHKIKIYQVKATTKDLEDIHSIKERVETNKTKLEKMKDIIERCEVYMSESECIYKTRIFKRDELRSTTIDECKNKFKDLTGKNGYEGTLEIDHERRILNVEMRVHNSTKAGSKSTLSGGERSYAFVCLLLSLWSYIESPVKVLDEFDVFMDDINRKRIIQLLFEFLKTSNTQAILITPLSTKELIDSEVDLKIIKK